MQNTLQRIEVPALSRDECNIPLIHSGRVTESMMCAGRIIATNPISGVCHVSLNY